MPFLLDFLAADFFALGDFLAAFFLAGTFFLADFFAAALEAFFAMIRTPFREADRMPRGLTASLPASRKSKALFQRSAIEFHQPAAGVSCPDGRRVNFTSRFCAAVYIDFAKPRQAENAAFTPMEP